MRTLAREKKVKAEYSFKRGEISNLMRIKQRFLYISTEYKKTSSHYIVCGKEGKQKIIMKNMIVTGHSLINNKQTVKPTMTKINK